MVHLTYMVNNVCLRIVVHGEQWFMVVVVINDDQLLIIQGLSDACTIGGN